MAAPQAAAASMLIRQSMSQAGVEPTAEAILSRLHESAQTRVDPVTGESYGTIDLMRAVATDHVDDELPAAQPPTLSRFIGTDDGDSLQLDLRDGITIRVALQSINCNPIHWALRC